MYKDDNMMTNGYSETLLRMMNNGRSDDAPSCNIGDRQRCDDKGWGLEGYPLASVFAPLQSFDNLYDAETALKQGTIFAELDLPFMGRTVQKGGCCHG